MPEAAWYSKALDSGEYIPATDSNRRRLALADDVLAAHLEGTVTISFQPICPKTNLTKVGCYDIDSHNPETDLAADYARAEGICRALAVQGVFGHIEFSGRRGWHIWIFSSEPVPAWFMRSALRGGLVLAGEDLKHIEIYPSGDRLSEQYYPRPIKLPFGVHRRGGRSCFVKGLDQGKPIPEDPLEFCRNIRVTPLIHLIELGGHDPERAARRRHGDAPVDLSILRGRLPACIETLTTIGVPAELEYNKANMTIARFGLATGLGAAKTGDLALAMAKATSGHPTSKRTVEDRMQNFETAYASMARSPQGAVWSCGYIKATELRKVCAGCPVETAGSRQALVVHERADDADPTPDPEAVINQNLNEADLVKIHAEISQRGTVAVGFVIENREDVFSAYLSGIAVSWKHGEAWLLSMDKHAEFIRGLLASEKVKVGYDLHIPRQVLQLMGLATARLWDVKVAAEVLEAGKPDRDTSLHAMGARYLGAKWPVRLGLPTTALEIAKQTAQLPSLALRLRDAVKAAGLTDVVGLENRFADVCALMCKCGVLVDTVGMSDYLAGSRVSGAAPFERLAGAVHPITGRVHPKVNQFGATGRVSFSEPPFQSMPTVLRQFVVAPPGWVLVFGDYSQIDVMVAAGLSKDPVMLEMFQRGGDAYREAAALFCGRAPDLVTDEERNRAKPVVLASLYGQGDRGMVQQAASQFGIQLSETEAHEMRERLLGKWAGLAAWQEDTVQRALRTGETRTISGRRRVFYTRQLTIPADKIESPEQLSALAQYGKLTTTDSQIVIETTPLGSAGVRKIIGRACTEKTITPSIPELLNSPIQGSSADITKLAHVYAMASDGLPMVGGYLILSVHDQLIGEVPEKAEADGMKLLESAMIRAGERYLPDVPLKIKSETGGTWR